MDDQSFRLLMSKLEGLEDGQTRMYLQFNERMDRQDELFTKHVDDDRAVSEKVDLLGKEVSFAKGVAYVLSGGTAFAAWISGHFR